MSDDKWGAKSVKDPVLTLVRWVKARSHNEKIILACLGGFVVGRIQNCVYDREHESSAQGNAFHRPCCCCGLPLKTMTHCLYCQRQFIL